MAVPSDLSRLSLRQAPTSRNSAPKPTTRPSGWFLKGPIPGEWLQEASALPGRAFHVGVAIWFLKGLKKSSTFKVTGQTLEKFSLHPDAYRRGLSHLESAGLVSVERKPGCAVVVTVLRGEKIRPPA